MMNGGWRIAKFSRVAKSITKCMPKTNDFLRPFFLDFWRVWPHEGLEGLEGLGLFLAPKINVFSLFFWCCNFLSIFKRFGKVLEGFGEDLGRAWEGLGRVWGSFWLDFGLQNDVWGSEWSWDVQKVFGNICLKFWANVLRLGGVLKPLAKTRDGRRIALCV